MRLAAEELLDPPSDVGDARRTALNIDIKDVYSLNATSAIEIGENTVIEQINGKLKTTHGKYVAQWEKQIDGSWQAKLDIGLEY